MALDLLHYRDGALADERDGHRVGAHAVARDAGSGLGCSEETKYMSATALLGIGAPACLLFSGAVVLFFRGKTVSAFVQLLGAGCLMVVVLAHVSEALHLFPWMQWGLSQSA